MGREVDMHFIALPDDFGKYVISARKEREREVATPV